MKKISLLSLFTLTLTLTLTLMFQLTANAASESTWYIGAQYTNQKITSSSDIKLDTAGIILGYKLNHYFSFETRLNIGVSDYSSSCPCGDEYKEHVYKQDIDNQGSLFIKGSYPLYNDFSIYALVGYTKSSYNLETKNHFTVVEGNSSITTVMFEDTGNHSENGFTYGVGLNYQITKTFSAFLDYQVLPDLTVDILDSSSWKSASIGINYTF